MWEELGGERQVFVCAPCSFFRNSQRELSRPKDPCLTCTCHCPHVPEHR